MVNSKFLASLIDCLFPSFTYFENPALSTAEVRRDIIAFNIDKGQIGEAVIITKSDSIKVIIHEINQ